MNFKHYSPTEDNSHRITNNDIGECFCPVIQETTSTYYEQIYNRIHRPNTTTYRTC
jgi:hypothetical protein